MTEKLSVAQVFPHQALSAFGEEGLTMIIRWYKISSIVSLCREVVCKRVEKEGSLDSARTASTGVERTMLVIAETA